jgi:hypothetical protein
MRVNVQGDFDQSPAGIVEMHPGIWDSQTVQQHFPNLWCAEQSLAPAEPDPARSLSVESII